MSRWVGVASVDEFRLNTCRVIEEDEAAVAVFNLGGEYFAIEDVCTHDGGKLAMGKLEGDEIVCPRHGARFSIRTGAVLSAPAYEDLRTFPVRVTQGMVEVQVE